MLLHRSGLALVLSCTAPVDVASAQTVIDGSGSALDLAIRAASPGDVFVVEGGPYSEVTIDVGVTLISTTNSPVSGVTVRDVPAGQSVHLVTVFTTSLALENCQGAVTVEQTIQPGTLLIDHCAQVALENGSFNRITSVESNLSLFGVRSAGQLVLDTGLVVEGGTVTMSRCEFRGQTATPPGTVSAGVELRSCEAFITSSTISSRPPERSESRDHGRREHAAPRSRHGVLLAAVARPAGDCRDRRRLDDPLRRDRGRWTSSGCGSATRTAS